MKIDREQIKFVLKSRNCLYLFIFFVKPPQVMFASLPKTFTYSGALIMCRGKFAVEIVYMGLFWAENNSDTY